MHHGGCLCGRVRYQYRGEIDELSMCHCTQCRKAQGSAFVAVAPVRSQDFMIVQGRDCLKEYRATPGKSRVFCSECGSPLYSARDDRPDVKRLRLGTLDTPVRPGTRYHAFVASKADWFDITDGLPQYPYFPSGPT